MARITLTFDNGPEPRWTDLVVEVLDRHRIAASFFVIGRKLALTPGGRDCVARAKDAGHRIGNHSWNHVYSLGDIDRPDSFEIEVEQTFEALGDLADPEMLFRPFCNAGRLDSRVFKRSDVEKIIERGYSCVIFNCVPRDWEKDSGWVERALADVGTREWSTVVLHDIDGYPDGIEARPMLRLEEFIIKAKEAGHEFVQAYSPDCVLVDRGQPRTDLEALMH